MAANRLKVVDLFCGAGGMSAGFALAGYQLVGALEFIPVFAASHAANFAGCITVCDDISTMSAKRFAARIGVKPGEVDIVVGGPPCQPFSNIGTPKIRSIRGEDSHKDERKYLFEPFLDYVEYLDPSAVLIENVPQLKTKEGGKLLDRIFRRLEDMAYVPTCTVLNAVNYGVPQSRKRLFIAGLRKQRFAFPAITHSFEDAIQLSLVGDERNVKNAVTVREALDDLPRIQDGCREDLLPYARNEPMSEFQEQLRNSDGLVGNNTCRMSNERAKKVFPHMPPGSKYMDLPPEVRQILPFREDIFHDRLKKLHPDKPSWTVLAHIGMDGYMYIHPWDNRTLSVREAARIQSFPDWFRFTGNMREQYVQVGNAVPPLLAKTLAHQFLAHLKKETRQRGVAQVR